MTAERNVPTPCVPLKGLVVTLAAALSCEPQQTPRARADAPGGAGVERRSDTVAPVLANAPVGSDTSKVAGHGKRTAGAVPETDTVAVMVRRIIATQLGRELSSLRDADSCIEDLGADSLDIMELIMELEKRFNIEIPDQDAKKLNTVGQVIRYVKTRVQSVASA
jgi:acyl carrier protein